MLWDNISYIIKIVKYWFPVAPTQQRPDLVILDNRMDTPDSGWRLLELMRLDPITNRIPAIFCSADKRFLDQKQEQLKSHYTETLEKPFELDDLLSKIRTLVGPAA